MDVIKNIRETQHGNIYIYSVSGQMSSPHELMKTDKKTFQHVCYLL